jgi:hypothetical protein
MDLLLPRDQDRRRRAGRADRQVERYHGRGVWRRVSGRALVASQLARRCVDRGRSDPRGLQELICTKFDSLFLK